jgi:hypothetical protein
MSVFNSFEMHQFFQGGYVNSLLYQPCRRVLLPHILAITWYFKFLMCVNVHVWSFNSDAPDWGLASFKYITVIWISSCVASKRTCSIVHRLVTLYWFLGVFFTYPFFFLLYCFYIYLRVYSLFGPPPPHPASRQNLFCPPVLQFCWRENIRHNKKDTVFLLVWDKVSYKRDS